MKRLSGTNQEISAILAQEQLELSRQNEDVEATVRDIIEAVKTRGDDVLRDYSKQFDGIDLADFEVVQDLIDQAFEDVDQAVLSALENAKANIESYHRQQLETGFEDQLKQSLDIIKQVAGSNDMIIDNLTYMQEAAFNSLLPFGKNYLEGVSRSLLTSNIAVNVPWTSVDIQDKGGKFYGINQISSNIISIDRGKLNTPSGLILGTSGVGKGMATKHEIISTKLKEADSDTEIIIVDPENEYSIIGQAFGGESIDIAPDSTTFLNVLDLSDENMDEEPVKVKSEFLLSWIGKLLDRKMDGREKSLIDRVTRLTYRHFDTPSLIEWVFILSQQPEQEAKDLALDMELYVEGSLDIFSHRTNIKTDSHFLIYNVKKLGDELKQIALMVIFDQIWNRVVKNQKLGKKTWIYFDEMQLLLLDKYASDFFFKL